MAYTPPTGNITTGVEVFSWVNSDLVNNLFFPLVLVAIFIIMITKQMYHATTISRAVASSSFTCMILSILLRITNLLDTTTMVIFIILTAISAVWMQLENIG